MKHFLLLYALIIPLSCCPMDNQELSGPDERINTLFGSVDRATLSKVVDELKKEGFYVGPHIHDVATGPKTYATPLSATPILTATQRKEENRRANKELIQKTQEMIAAQQDLNSFINFDWDHDTTIVCLAANHKCRQPILKLALENGADSNKANGAGSTPLQIAAIAYCAANVNFLLQKGATFDFEDKDKMLLSHICSPAHDRIGPKSTARRVSTLKALLAAGANPNTTDLSYRTPSSPSLLSNLLRHFALMTILGKKGPIYQEQYNTFLDQRKEMIVVLLEAGLNPFKKNETGKTDWENIVENKSHYDVNLFNFAQEQVKKKLS